MRTLLIALLLAVCCLPGLARQSVTKKLPPIDFTQDYLSLPPDYFPELPERLAAWLTKRHCWIAQPHVYDFFDEVTSAYPTNVVHGDYDGHGPDDWAMIINYREEIYLGVFWDGGPQRGEIIPIESLGYDVYSLVDMEKYGKYKGYGIFLFGESMDELNDKIVFPEILDYRFDHGGIRVYADDFDYLEPDEYCPVLYWDGNNWQSFGQGGDALYIHKTADWGESVRASSSLPPIDFTQDTLSLPPVYFPELPPELRAWLEEREYRIPQVHDLYIEQFTEGFQKRDRYNVVAGNFDGQGEQDWVFATFRDDTLKAFICWNADVNSIEQLDISEFDRYPGGLTISSLESDKYPIGYTSIGYRGTNVLSFEIVLAIVRRDWLNEDVSSNLQKIYGDSTALPTVFNHDGFVVNSDRDLWDGGFVRYYDKGRWLRFRHTEAELRATLDTLLLKEYLEKNE